MSWILRFHILGYWHSGGGSGLGGLADAAVQRSPDGLPWLPGRTVRGLVREALVEAEELAHEAVPPGFPEWLCGEDPTAAPDEQANEGMLRRQRYVTRSGAGQFDSAELPEDWRRWARTPESRVIVDEMFDVLSATAIETDGIVRRNSLRTVEVAIPVTLDARLTLIPDSAPAPADVGGALLAALPLLRGLGAGRHRGLGRVKVSVLAEAEAVR